MDATRLPPLGPHGEGWVVLQVVLFLLLALAGLAAGDAWGGSAAVITAAVGLLLIVLGGTLVVRAIIDLGRALTPMPRPRAGATLIESGTYRLVRHPIYGGLVLVATGWALLMASLWALLLAALVLAFFDLKSRLEEVWLVERYPGYLAYRARTRRLIPGVY